MLHFKFGSAVLCFSFKHHEPEKVIAFKCCRLFCLGGREASSVADHPFLCIESHSSAFRVDIA